jgi:hypothetical protein
MISEDLTAGEVIQSIEYETLKPSVSIALSTERPSPNDSGNTIRRDGTMF